MNLYEEIEISIEDFFEICRSQGGAYQILAPDGWQDINFLVEKDNKESYNLLFEDNPDLGCSADHYVMTLNRGWVKAEDLNVKDDRVDTKNGSRRMIAKEYLGLRKTFDLNVKSETHSYFANDVVSHNTGKSMTCDALASYYNMPLLRLDVGSIFSSLVGESEQNMRNVVKISEAIAPCILWIDEIEKGIGGVKSSNQTDSGVTSRVFGTLLTWMQEKLAPVFVVCTGNNTCDIPAEFMRAGRFDEIFFVDLPSTEQREEVIECILLRKKRNPEEFDIKTIASQCENYSPAEIEKVINNALFVAYSDNKRPLETKDILGEIGKFQPLYNTKREDIEHMRKWALGEDGVGGRAVLANSPKSQSIAKPVINSARRKLDIEEFDL